ncbi:MAG: type II secretion system F family protein [Nocardioidaceae bacterium]
MTVVVGASLGGLATVGLLLVVSRLLASRRPSLESRVAPYIKDVPTAVASWEPRQRSDTAAGAFTALLAPAVQRGAARLQRLLGGRASVQRRLDRAGSALTVEQFRVSQVVWGLCGFGFALLVGVLGPGREPGRAVVWLVLCFGVGAVAMMARDSALTRQIKLREQRILSEFPVVADLLALSVAAGEGPVAALDRVVTRCRGALPDELAKVLAEARVGVSITAALGSLANRTGLAVVARFAEGFAVAIERGTPLVDVLSAQSSDVREAAKRELIESGARKEISMMVPVVFLIMPVTLLFAFFPGVVGLNLLAP